MALCVQVYSTRWLCKCKCSVTSVIHVRNGTQFSCSNLSSKSRKKMHAAADRHNATASHSAGAHNDLEFVAQLLGDPAGPSGVNAPSSMPCTRRHKAAKKRPRATLSEDTAEPPKEAKTLLTRYNTPTRKPDSKRYFCEACSCSVSARGNDWDIHVSGVKHQRQLVSLLHTGQLGNTIVSLFEAEPGTVRHAFVRPGTARCFGSACACFAVRETRTADYPQSSADYGHLDKTRLQNASTQVLKVSIAILCSCVLLQLPLPRPGLPVVPAVCQNYLTGSLICSPRHGMPHHSCPTFLAMIASFESRLCKRNFAAGEGLFA